MARATDPVCGMDVDPGTAAQATHESQTYYFCSEQCLRAFRAEPERFAAGTERHDPPFTVTEPMTAPRFGSAGSGGLENEPMPEIHDRP